jgi:ubiquinone/menaquinone biosynthesis C-methylase UbiE
MTAVAERYDAVARDYVRYWEPVLADTALRLLDRVEADVQAAIGAAKVRWRVAGPARLLDVGTGAGTLALGALRRWQELQVVGLDASAGMLEVARERASDDPDRLDIAARLKLLRGPADRIPLPDRSVDLAVSSFVFQLVPDRGAAFRDVFRVLRPGGRLAFVTWLDQEEDDFAPRRIVDELLDELGVPVPEEPEDEEVAGDFVSPRAAADQLRKQGFREVSSREEMLRYRWERDDFLEYKLHYAERGAVATLEEERWTELWRRSHERLRELESADFEWRTPVVSATGVRPG